MKRILSALALVLVTCMSARAEAQTLYAATGANGVPGSLYTVDPATGVSTLVGPTTVGGSPIGLTGLAFHPATGVLYGVTSNTPPANPNIHSLVTINPATGVAAVLGVLANPVGDIAFSPSGILYGWGATLGAPGLYTISLVDATQVLIAPSDFTGGGGNGLSFSRGTLYLAGNAAANQGTAGATGAFRSVDTTTGATTVVSTLTGAPQPGTVLQPGQMSAIATDPAKVLYAVNSGNGGTAACNLVVIDPATGVVTDHGALPDNTDALAFTNPVSENLYAATGSNGTPGVLYNVDSSTAAATALGPVVITATIPVVCGTPPCPLGITGLAFHPATHVLYGVTGNGTTGGATNPHVLVTIDPATGVATFIGDMGSPAGDITFNPDGTLFGWLAGGSPGRLVTIDLATAAQTPVGVGPDSFFAAGGRGLSFAGTTLYLTANGAQDVGGPAAANSGALRTVDPATGISTVGPTLTGAPQPDFLTDPGGIGVINALAGNLAGALFGVNADTAAVDPILLTPSALANLVTIDPATGVVTDHGALPNNTDALAFSAVADLTIAKTHSGNFTRGQVGATYTITVTNVGSGSSSGPVTVTDIVPVGLTATAITGSGWTCTQPSGPCTRNVPLAVNSSFAAITLTVDVASDAPATVTNTATVDGGGDANFANNTANDLTTINSPADLTIAKTHVGSFTQGQIGATYTITVSNVGQAASAGLVTVTDTLPATGLTATGIAGTGWTCTQPSGPCTRADALGGGLSYPALTLTVNVAAGVPATVTNTATVSGGGDANAANNTSSDPTTTISAVDLTITKTHTGNFRQGQVGATYLIRVTNVGAGTTRGTVTVTDAVPAGLTATSISSTSAGWVCTQPSGPCTNINLLAPGQSYLPLTLTVNVAGNAPAQVTNTATVSGGADTNAANNTANDITTITGGADLTITKSHTGNFRLGQVGATYTIRVTNVGSTTSSGLITVTDALPAGLTATSITSPSTGWTCTQPSGPCTNPNLLAPGLSFLPLVLTVNVAANAPALVTNTATVSGGGDTTPGNNTASDPTTIVSTADLTITKTHTGNFSQAQVGATYTITVTNVGTATSSGLITVTDTLPAGLTATSISSTSAGWTCTQPSGPCTNPNLLGPGLSFLPLTLTVNVAANAMPSVTNTVTVSGGGDVSPANNTASDPTTVLSRADLTIAKTHTGNFTRGQVGAKYTITVTNVGTGTSRGLITVTDTLPVGLTATSISSTSAGWTCTQPSGPCTNPNLLAPGLSFLPLTLTVDVAADAPASVTNTVTISGGSDINAANNTANDITTVNP